MKRWRTNNKIEEREGRMDKREKNTKMEEKEAKTQGEKRKGGIVEGMEED